MFRPSSRDLSLAGSLLPLFAREITADPEQHNRARREARVRDYKEIGRYVNQSKAEAERRQDDELRARLDGERVDGPLKRPSDRVARPTPRAVPTPRPVARPFAPTNPTATHNTSAHARRPATANGHSFPFNNLSTPDTRSPNQVFPAPNTTRPAKTNTHDQTLLNTGMVVSSEARTSGVALITCQASGSVTVPVAGPRPTIALNDEPMPDIGAQQSHTSARQYAHAVLPLVTATRQPAGHDKTAAEGANLPEAPPREPAVASPLDPTSAGSARSRDPKQQPRIAEARLPSDLLHRRDFEVKSIRDKRAVSGSTLFFVRWRSTWVPLDAIVMGSDHECSYVKADGTTWSIRKELKSRVRNGLEERRVRWTSTWEPLENLANAQEAIAKFEMTRQQGLDDEQGVRRRTVLTFEESKFPRGMVQPQSERDYAASQEWVACTWPVIRPHPTLDLYPAIYRIQMELLSLKPTPKANHMGKSYRDFMRHPQVRPLQWSEDSLKSGRPFRFNRRKRASLFIQVTGALDTNCPCDRCLGEKQVAPFVGCVRTAPDQQSWLGGACANCGTQDSSYCLHHNKGIMGRASHNRTSHRGNAGYHREPAVPAGMQGVFNADGADDDDDADSDDDDSESDSDDDVDDEIDPGIHAQHVHHLENHASAATQRHLSDKNPDAAQSLVRAYPPPLSAANPPVEHTRPGKLPKISKIRRVAVSASPPPTPPTSQLSQDSTDSDEFGFQPRWTTGVAAPGDSQHSVYNSLPRARSITEIHEENTLADEDFEPDPLEQDLMELLWKHETPARSIEGHPPNTVGRLERDTGIPSAAVQTPRTDSLPRGPEEGRRGNEYSRHTQNSPPTTADGGDQPPARRKRRADSLELRSKRPSLGLCGQSRSDFTDHATLGPSTRRKEISSSEPPSQTFMSIRSLEKMELKSIHEGCVAGQPCKNHESGRRPRPRDPHVKVFHNTLDSRSCITVEQAEYILSRSNCYWAWIFSRIWKLWCKERRGIDAQDYSQVELLMDCADKLRGAAWDCCPRGERLVVEID